MRHLRMLGRRPVSTPRPPVAATAHAVHFTAELTSAAAAIEALAGDRYDCSSSVIGDVQIVVTGPRSPEDMARLRNTYERAEIIVWDRRDAPPASDVASCLEHGADAYVTASWPQILVAHLDALLRRPRG